MTPKEQAELEQLQQRFHATSPYSEEARQLLRWLTLLGQQALEQSTHTHDPIAIGRLQGEWQLTQKILDHCTS